MRFILITSLCFFVLYTMVGSNATMAQSSKKTPLPGGVMESLKMAGTNRSELEKVIAKYSKHAADSLKLKAAYFLIDNMKWHYTTNKVIQLDSSFSRVILMADSLYYAIVKDKTLKELKTDSLNNKIKEAAPIVNKMLAETRFEEPGFIPGNTSDLEGFGALFLIDHIEHAFEKWVSSPLVSKLGFSQFCDYVLPYRLINGFTITKSSREIENFFSKYLATANLSNMVETIEQYNLTLDNFRKFLNFYPFSEKVGFMDWLFFYESKINMDCFDIGHRAVSILNSCGIPVSIEHNVAFKLQCGRHAHCAFPEELGNWTIFSYGYNRPLPKNKSGLYEPDDGPFWLNNYRMHFSAQPNTPFFLKATHEFIPNGLSSPCIEDVSPKRMMNVQLKIPFDIPTGHKLAYLATFKPCSGFTPVIWGLLDKPQKSVTFNNVVVNVLYFPMYYEGSEATLFGKPFYLKQANAAEGNYKMFFLENDTANTAEQIDIIVTRKYAYKESMMEVAKRLIGTVVLASNDTNEPMDTVYRLDFAPGPFFQEIKLNISKPYKYYRIQAPPTAPEMNFAEVEFLTDRKYNYTNICPPTRLPVFYPNQKHDDTTLVRVIEGSLEELHGKPEYDGSMETAPNHSSNIQFTLKHPQTITTIRFAPLNANNGIVPTNEYQLRYWSNGKWNDFEYAVIAEYNYLEFKGVPKGKLYWLRNFTAGKEEVPFIINEKGEQVFLYMNNIW